MTPGLPTPRTTLRARYVSLLVWCKGGCQHQAEADLQKLIDTGRGDVPLTRLRFPLLQLRQRPHGLGRRQQGRDRGSAVAQLARVEPS